LEIAVVADGHVSAAHDKLEFLALARLAEKRDVVFAEAAVVLFHLFHEALVAVFRSAAAENLADGFLLVLGEELADGWLGDRPVGAVLLAERIIERLANGAFLLVIETVVEPFDSGFGRRFGFLIGSRDPTQE